jgi:hypothetical protein
MKDLDPLHYFLGASV